MILHIGWSLDLFEVRHPFMTIAVLFVEHSSNGGKISCGSQNVIFYVNITHQQRLMPAANFLSKNYHRYFYQWNTNGYDEVH